MCVCVRTLMLVASRRDKVREEHCWWRSLEKLRSDPWVLSSAVIGSSPGWWWVAVVVVVGGKWWWLVHQHTYSTSI